MLSSLPLLLRVAGGNSGSPHLHPHPLTGFCSVWVTRSAALCRASPAPTLPSPYLSPKVRLSHRAHKYPLPSRFLQDIGVCSLVLPFWPILSTPLRIPRDQLARSLKLLMGFRLETGSTSGSQSNGGVSVLGRLERAGQATQLPCLSVALVLLSRAAALPAGLPLILQTHGWLGTH